jgi:glycosyltransferase involved in cell wall biosynthesis
MAPARVKHFSFFYRINGGGSIIRAKQIAAVLDGRIKPKEDYADDVCIYLLGMIPEGKEPENAYHDVIDCGGARLSRVRGLTRGPIISTSVSHHEAMKALFPDRDIFMIPHHHCNYFSEHRLERPVKVVGCLGGDDAVQLDHAELRRRLYDIGLEWRFSGYSRMNREQIVEFYKGLDIQITFRNRHPRNILDHMNPIKLSNAASFGIPTVAYPEPGYAREWKDACLWATSIDEVVDLVRSLANEPDLYATWSEKAHRKSEEYHIDCIARKYEALPWERA